MSKKVVGKVDRDTVEKVKTLHTRRMALETLFKGLSEDSPLYEKVVSDIGLTMFKLSEFWSKTSKEQKWESVDGQSWEIDFETGEILIKDSSCGTSSCKCSKDKKQTEN